MEPSAQTGVRTVHLRSDGAQTENQDACRVKQLQAGILIAQELVMGER
jgi:hypothetical protein